MTFTTPPIKKTDGVVDRIAHELQTTEMTVKEIFAYLGISNTFRLRALFLEKHGYTYAAYRLARPWALLPISDERKQQIVNRVVAQEAVDEASTQRPNRVPPDRRGESESRVGDHPAMFLRVETLRREAAMDDSVRKPRLNALENTLPKELELIKVLRLVVYRAIVYLYESDILADLNIDDKDAFKDAFLKVFNVASFVGFKYRYLTTADNPLSFLINDEQYNRSHDICVQFESLVRDLKRDDTASDIDLEQYGVNDTHYFNQEFEKLFGVDIPGYQYRNFDELFGVDIPGSQCEKGQQLNVEPTDPNHDEKPQEGIVGWMKPPPWVAPEVGGIDDALMTRVLFVAWRLVNTPMPVNRVMDDVHIPDMVVFLTAFRLLLGVNHLADYRLKYFGHMNHPAVECLHEFEAGGGDRVFTSVHDVTARLKNTAAEPEAIMADQVVCNMNEFVDVFADIHGFSVYEYRDRVQARGINEAVETLNQSIQPFSVPLPTNDASEADESVELVVYVSKNPGLAGTVVIPFVVNGVFAYVATVYAKRGTSLLGGSLYEVMQRHGSVINALVMKELRVLFYGELNVAYLEELPSSGKDANDNPE